MILSAHLSIVLAASLAAISCAILGVFLVLRKDALLGDAISHAILPGLAFAFLITESRATIPMFLGAAVFGVLTAFMAQYITNNSRIDRNAALGIVFTNLFALGIIVLRLAADHVDLDPGCVLYGLLELTPIDTMMVFGFEIPRAVVILSFALLLNIVFVTLFFKELVITSFDPQHAQALGIKTALVHYMLMTAVAVTSVAAFESVGSILVVALFIVPAATARLLTDKLSLTFVIAVIAALLSSSLGYYAADTLSTSVAGTITVVAGMLLALAVIFSPSYGLIAKSMRRLQQRIKIYREDTLGLLYRLQEDEIPTFPATPANVRHALGGVVAYFIAMHQLRISGLVGLSKVGLYELTEKGFQEASTVVRSHRLWETYLTQTLDLEPDHVHKSATTLEHFTSPEMAKQLSAEVSDVTEDPHGKKIP